MKKSVRAIRLPNLTHTYTDFATHGLNKERCWLSQNLFHQHYFDKSIRKTLVKKKTAQISKKFSFFLCLIHLVTYMLTLFQKKRKTFRRKKQNISVCQHFMTLSLYLEVSVLTSQRVVIGKGLFHNAKDLDCRELVTKWS